MLVKVSSQTAFFVKEQNKHIHRHIIHIYVYTYVASGVLLAAGQEGYKVSASLGRISGRAMIFSFPAFFATCYGSKPDNISMASWKDCTNALDTENRWLAQKQGQ